MSAPVRVQGDPVEAIGEALRVYLAAEDPLPYVAKWKWPKDWSPALGRPVVLVADDGGPLDYPVKSDHTIRITVGGDDIPAVRRLARKCLGEILANLPEGLEKIRPNGTALTEAHDSATGADLASGTVTAVIRTEIVA